jgi:hypothetical protein
MSPAVTRIDVIRCHGHDGFRFGPFWQYDSALAPVLQFITHRRACGPMMGDVG